MPSLFTSRRCCLHFSLLIPFTIGLFACATTTPEQSQDALVRRFYQRIAEGDFDGCISLISATHISKQELAGFDKKLRRILASGQELMNSRGGLLKVEVLERTVDAAQQVTKLRAQVFYRDGSSRRERINLFEENGVWKVQL